MAGPMEIVGVGIATIDIIQEVDVFPEEDSKVRLDLASNGNRYWVGDRHSVWPPDPSTRVEKDTAIAAQLGCKCHWLGTMTDPARDNDAAFVVENLQSFGVDTSTATVLPSGSMPISYIVASQATGSRTIIHHRDLPELTFESFRARFDKLAVDHQHNPARDRSRRLWVHFEGRNLDNVEQMMQFLNEQCDVATMSLEIEALRNDWNQAQRVLRFADVAFVSKDYIRKKLELQDAKAFFDHLRTLWREDWRPRAIICPWGCDGVYYYEVATHAEHHVPTSSLSTTVDSVGAGDSFIGAALAAFACCLPLHVAVDVACRVATAKCKQQGFRLTDELRREIVASLVASDRQT